MLPGDYAHSDHFEQVVRLRLRYLSAIERLEGRRFPRYVNASEYEAAIRARIARARDQSDSR